MIKLLSMRSSHQTFAKYKPRSNRRDLLLCLFNCFLLHRAQKPSLAHFLINTLMSLEHVISTSLTSTKAKQSACFREPSTRLQQTLTNRTAIGELEPSLLATTRKETKRTWQEYDGLRCSKINLEKYGQSKS